MGRQPVVYMHGLQFNRMAMAQAQQDMQQDDRVESTREPKNQSRAGRDVADQCGRHGPVDGLIWQGFP